MTFSLKGILRASNPVRRVFFVALWCAAVVPASQSFAEPVDSAPVDSGRILLFDDGSEAKPAAVASDQPPAFDLGGMVELRGGTDLDDDDFNEHDELVRGVGRLWLQWPAQGMKQLGNWRSRLYLSVETDYLYMGDERSQRDFDLELYENKLLLANGPFEIELGKQIVRWGKSDQLSPVDNVNPQDLREFIVPELEDRKLPVWMARARWFFDGWAAEGVFIPWHESADIDYFDSDWGVYRHVKGDVQDAALPEDLKGYLMGLRVSENDPPNTLKNSEFGARLTTTIGRWDWGASIFYGREDLPFFGQFPIKNLALPGAFSSRGVLQALDDAVLTDENIEVYYPRQTIVGLEFESTLGVFGVRGESAYFDQTSFLLNDLTSDTRPVLHTVVGGDYTGVSGFYGNLQLSHRYIHNYDDSIMYFDRHNVSLLGEVRQEGLRGTVEGYLRFNCDLHDGGYYLEPGLVYSGVKNLDLTLGLNIFGGDQDTFLGYYDDNDQVFLKAKYHF
jgi:hypothetical protein